MLVSPYHTCMPLGFCTDLAHLEASFQLPACSEPSLGTCCSIDRPLNPFSSSLLVTKGLGCEMQGVELEFSTCRFGKCVPSCLQQQTRLAVMST